MYRTFFIKRPRLPLYLCSIAAFSTTGVQAATSSIEQVTIYQGLASVTRALPIAGSGEQTLVFSCLSPFIDKDSLSVQAANNANIGEVSIERVSGEQAAACQYQGDAKVQSQQDRVADINAELEAARLAGAYLKNLTQASHVTITGTLANNARELESQAAVLNKRILRLEQQKAKAAEALSQLSAKSDTLTRHGATSVSVRTASRTPSTLKLAYQVRGAGWEPSYQARLDTKSARLTITASAIIAQQTGENWLNVPVLLSAANPSQQTKGQLPVVPRLSLYDPNQARVMNAQPVMAMDAAPVVAALRAEQADASNLFEPLPSFTVSSQNKNGIIEYRLPQRISLPSDGSRVRTVIDEQSGTSKLWVQSTPSRELAAYWYASAPFLTPAWSDGAMQLYRDDNYVGQSRYSYQGLKEQGIGFGVDPTMIVKALTDTDKKGDKGAFNRLQTQTYTQAYDFTNQHSQSRRLQVLSGVPISRDDDIKVAVTHTPPISTPNWNDNQGISAWEFVLPSQQSQVVQTTYQISYPANKTLAGHR